MIKRKPQIVFTIGLLITIFMSTLYYFTIPKFEYFAGNYAIYRPGNILPEIATNKYTVSNTYLLIKLTKYATIYWVTFIIFFFVADNIGKVKIKPIYTYLQFSLTILGFSLLTYFNKYIINPHHTRSGYLSDTFDERWLNQEHILEGYKLILWYDSLSIQSSIFGIILCMSAILIFLFGMIHGLNVRLK